jgi:uncharacterized protein (DUF433 family)
MYNWPQKEVMYLTNEDKGWEDRIALDPRILAGKPVIRGTRLAVEFIIELLAEGWSYEDILQNYPQLTREDILASLRWASEILHAERVYPLPRPA